MLRRLAFLRRSTVGRTGSQNHLGTGFVAIETQSAPAQALSFPSRQAEIASFAALLLLTIGLRLIPILVTPSLNWADEVFQGTEQAHRLVYGTGLVPWEFQLGVRSWVLPGFIAALMEAARLFGDGPDYYLPVIAITFAALGTAPVICGYLWCRRSFGVSGAILGGLVVAVAPELIYFGARPLMDVIAGHLLVIALYVLEPGYAVTNRRRLYLGGALLGALLVLRIQLLFMLALLIGRALLKTPRTGRSMLLAGAATAVLCAALLDMVTLGAPLASVWRYVWYNIFYGVSSTFGTEPWSFYFAGEFGLWRGSIVALLVLVALGARRLPLLLICAAIIVATDSAIAHKEYRFIYPAIVLIAVLVGVGLAQLAAWGRDWIRARDARHLLASNWFLSVLGLAYWSVLGLIVWTGPLASLRNLDHDYLRAVGLVEHADEPCGVGLYGHDGQDWGWSGGYSYLQHPVPLYWPKDAAEFAALHDGFDTLISIKPPPPGFGYVTQQCFNETCVARRPGSCAALPMIPMPFPDPIAQFRPVRK